MDKPTLAFTNWVPILVALGLALSPMAPGFAQVGESYFDSEMPASYSSSGNFFSRKLGTAFRVHFQTEGYGVEDNFVTLGTMKVFNLEGATVNLDAQATLSNDFGGGYNAGIFLRELVDLGFGPDSQRIMGIGFWSDGQSTSADNFLNQLGVTVESLGDSYDLRFQGNFPLEDMEDSDPFVINGAEPVYEENALMSELLRFQRDIPLTVLDLEAAKRVMNLEAWAFLGGYHLEGEGYDATGYRGGVRGYPVPDVALSVQVTEDDIYDTNVVFGLTWFVGRTTSANQQCGNVLDRFREPVQRNAYIATVQENIDDAITPFTDPNDNAFVFIHVDDDTPAGTGDGTFENPYSTLAEAEAGSDEDDIILVHSDSTIADVGFTAQDGQRILGEGVDPNGDTVEHSILTFDGSLVVLPETADGAQDLLAPIINGVAASGGDPNDPNSLTPIFLLADDNEVNNFRINADPNGTDIAVYANESDEPQLANLDIDGPFLYGVVLNEVTGNSLVENSVTIDDTTVAGMYVIGGSSNVGANATVTNSEGNSVIIENREGGSVTVGEINDTGLGILVQNNDAGTIDFSSLATVITDGADSAVTLLNNEGTTITFQELQATSEDGDTFVVNGGGTVTVNNTQGDEGSDIINTGDGSAVVVRGDDVDPNSFDGSATLTINGDITNSDTDGGGTGYAVDAQELNNSTVILAGNITDTDAAGRGILVENNVDSVFSFSGTTQLNTGDQTAVELNNNSGSSVAFTDLRATADDADTFSVAGAGTITVTDPNETGFINNTGTGSAVVILGADDPNGFAVGNPSVTIDPNVANAGGGFAVDIQQLTDGAIDFNGNVRDNDGLGSGIQVLNSTDATVSFDGDTVLVTDDATAVNLRNNLDSTILFNNLRATADDADTFVVFGGGNVTVNDPNDDGFIDNTGTGSALVVVGADDPNAVGDPNVAIDVDIDNSGGGLAVDIQDLTGGSVVVNGDVTDLISADGGGVLVVNNENANIDFNGDNTLNTGASTAVVLRNNDGSTIRFADLTATSTTADTFVVEGGGSISVEDPNDDASIQSNGSGSALVVRGADDPNTTANPDLVVFADVINTGSGQVVDIQDMTGGIVTVSGNVDDSSQAGSGILIQDNSGGIFSFGGETTLDTDSNDALTMTDNDGSFTRFTDLQATAEDGDTVVIQGGGRIVFDDPNDDSFITNTGNGTALLVQGDDAGFTEDPNVTVDLDITNSSGGNSVNIEDMNAGQVQINGEVNDTGDGILVQRNTDAAVIQFTDLVTVDTSTGDAVALIDNTDADISFNGLDITVDSGFRGFTATGGGNLTVLNAGGTTIQQNGTSTALEINGMTIAAGGATFDTVNVTGGTSTAIELIDVDGTGVLTIGSGTDPNEGGQIATTGIGIDVSNVANLDVSNIRIEDGNTTGIRVRNQEAGSSATFDGMDVSSSGTTGIQVSGNDDGVIAFSDTTVTATGTADAVVNANNDAATVSYTELTATSVAGDTFTIQGGGTINVIGAGSSITNSGGGDALVVLGADAPSTTGNPTASIAGEVENTGTGQVVNVSQLTGGSVTVSADVTDTSGTGSGILIENNDAGTVTFSGIVELDTATNTALTIQTNGSNNSVTFNAASRLDVDTNGATGILISDTGAVSILGSGNTVDTAGGSDVGIFIDNDSNTSDMNVRIDNTTVNATSTAIDIDHQSTTDTAVTLNGVTIASSGGTAAVDVEADGNGELDVVVDSIDISVGDIDGIFVDTGSNANRVDVSILGTSAITVGDGSAFEAVLDDTDTADVRFLVQGDEQEFINESADAAFNVVVNSDLSLSATIGEGPSTTDPNDPTNIDPPQTPLGDVNSFVNNGTGFAFQIDNSADGAVTLDLRDNTANDTVGNVFNLINDSTIDFFVVDFTETVTNNATNNPTSTVNTSGGGSFDNIFPPVLQPTAP